MMCADPSCVPSRRRHRPRRPTSGTMPKMPGCETGNLLGEGRRVFWLRATFPANVRKQSEHGRCQTWGGWRHFQFPFVSGFVLDVSCGGLLQAMRYVLLCAMHAWHADTLARTARTHLHARRGRGGRNEGWWSPPQEGVLSQRSLGKAW